MVACLLLFCSQVCRLNMAGSKCINIIMHSESYVRFPNMDVRVSMVTVNNVSHGRYFVLAVFPVYRHTDTSNTSHFEFSVSSWLPPPDPPSRLRSGVRGIQYYDYIITITEVLNIIHFC